MMAIEEQQTEFKADCPEDLARDVVALANSEGGNLWIGMCADETSAGAAADPDQLMCRISDALFETIEPDVLPFVRLNTAPPGAKTAIRLRVSPGPYRPYYLKSAGMTPSGVFARRGGASVPLTALEIRKMLDAAGDGSFESRRALCQELTFEAFAEFMNSHQIKFSGSWKSETGFTGADGLYTNLALLLSDQCTHCLKAAVFNGGEVPELRDCRTFKGSLLKQISEALEFIVCLSPKRAACDGRTDAGDFPEEAVREVLVNAMAHRDYTLGDSTFVRIFEDRLQIVSVGGMPSGFSLEAAMLGASMPRNKALMAFLCRLGLAHSCGSGIQKIENLYANSSDKPEFKAVAGAFSAVLPVRGCGDRDPRAPQAAPLVFMQTAPGASNYKTLTEKSAVVAAVAAYGKITRQQVQALLHVSKTRAYMLLKDMAEHGEIQMRGNGPGRYYIPSQQN
jgi:ATP-dependent DNA helicase RecG